MQRKGDCMWCKYRKRFCNNSRGWGRVNSSCYGKCPYHSGSASSATNEVLYGAMTAPTIWNEDDYPNPTVGETFQEYSIEIDDSWSDSGSSWGGSDGGDFDGGSW